MQKTQRLKIRLTLCINEPNADSLFPTLRTGFFRDGLADGDGDGELSELGLGPGLGDDVARGFVTSATVCAGFHQRDATAASAIITMTAIIESSAIR